MFQGCVFQAIFILIVTVMYDISQARRIAEFN